jgi:hypothetical protein
MRATLPSLLGQYATGLANAVLFLPLDESSFITAIELFVARRKFNAI